MPKTSFSNNSLAFLDSVLTDHAATRADKFRASKIMLSYKSATTKQRKVVANLRKRLADALARIDELEEQLDLKESAEVVPMAGQN